MKRTYLDIKRPLAGLHASFGVTAEPAAAGRVSGQAMDVKQNDKGRRPMNRKRERDRSAIGPGFERWLDKQLHAMYEPVLHEGIPDDLNELLQQFETKQREPSDKS